MLQSVLRRAREAGVRVIDNLDDYPPLDRYPWRGEPGCHTYLAWRHEWPDKIKIGHSYDPIPRARRFGDTAVIIRADVERDLHVLFAQARTEPPPRWMTYHYRDGRVERKLESDRWSDGHTEWFAAPEVGALVRALTDHATAEAAAADYHNREVEIANLELRLAELRRSHKQHPIL